MCSFVSLLSLPPSALVSYGSLLAAFDMDELHKLEISATLGAPRFAPAPIGAAPAPAPDAELVDATRYLLADGGNVENLGAMPLLQRGVRSVVLFDGSVNALANATTWDPSLTPPQVKYVDGYLAALFGFDTFAGASGDGEQYVGGNQVFRAADFAPLCRALQAAQAAGGGAVAQLELETVANAVMGVRGGDLVLLTVVYMDAPARWTAQLPDDVRAELAKGADGDFKDFPNYATSALDLTPSQVNLLADMMTWIVLENEDVFRAAVEYGE